MKILLYFESSDLKFEIHLFCVHPYFSVVKSGINSVFENSDINRLDPIGVHRSSWFESVCDIIFEKILLSAP